MKKIIVCFCLFLLSHFLFAQNFKENLLKVRDSLKTELNKLQNEPSSVEIQRQITLSYEYIDADSSIYYGQKFIEAAEKFQDNNRLLDALGIVSLAYIYKGDLPKALELSLRAVQIYDENPGLISTIYMPGIGPAYGCLSEIYFQIGDIDKAQEYALKVIDLNLEGSKIAAGFGHFQLARIYEKINQLDSALKHINLSKQNFKDVMNEAGIFTNQYDANAEVYNLLAKVYLKQGKTAQALAELKNILAINVSKGEHLNTAKTYLDLAYFYSSQNSVDSSIYYAGKAMTESEKNDFVSVKLEAYSLLSQKYESIDPVIALAYFKEATALQNGLYGAGNIQVLKDMIAQNEKKREEIETAKVEFAQKLRTYTFLGVTLILLTIAGFLYRNNKQAKKAKLKIESAFHQLKSTQAQLIQSEKMASLGELTAGIAHEIQNPLNFVNNFSEVSTELVDEMNEELAVGNKQLATGNVPVAINHWQAAVDIANDLKQNLEKINHHGKRAGDIVKGMLQHSRSSSGQKEPTDINALCDEYLRLSYHGLRAKDKSFNAKFETDFDTSIPKLNVVPQNIGRVVLNLINNAFYAVNERQKLLAASFKLQANYEPTVSVSTKKQGSKVLISVKDNGNGIPDSIKEKIFQPFFTTKPTGQGTGLGLSLSYDIVKAHGGQLKVETKEGEGSKFIIQLPIV